MSSADFGNAEVIVLDDTAYIDEVVNESKSDPVMAVQKRYISEVDFEYVRQDNSPIRSSVMRAHVVFLMEAYTTKYADRRHPEDSKMCLAFDSCFVQSFTSRKRSRSGRAPYSLGRLTLPPMQVTEFEAIDTNNLALVFFPTLVELGGEISTWALLVFCFERKTCFYCCDELTPPLRDEHPAYPAFVAIIKCFQEIWQVDTDAWSLVDIAPRQSGDHAHGVFTCGINVLQLTHSVLRTFWSSRTRQPFSENGYLPVEVGFPAVCACTTYRDVIVKTLTAAALPESFL
jgi:hypothetical protein